jgi:hypothetical protein
MKDWLHRLAHRLGWNRGCVDTCLDPEDKSQFFLYFRCEGCGLITGITAIKYEGIERRWSKLQ